MRCWRGRIKSYLHVRAQHSLAKKVHPAYRVPEEMTVSAGLLQRPYFSQSLFKTQPWFKNNQNDFIKKSIEEKQNNHALLRFESAFSHPHQLHPVQYHPSILRIHWPAISKETENDVQHVLETISAQLTEHNRVFQDRPSDYIHALCSTQIYDDRFKPDTKLTDSDITHTNGLSPQHLAETRFLFLLVDSDDEDNKESPEQAIATRSRQLDERIEKLSVLLTDFLKYKNNDKTITAGNYLILKSVKETYDMLSEQTSRQEIEQGEYANELYSEAKRLFL